MTLIRRFYDTDNAAGGGADKGDKPKTFTQEEVNGFVAEEKRKFAKQLEDQKKVAGTTEAQKAELEKQIKELRAGFQTKEETLLEQHQTQLKELTGTVESLKASDARWRNAYAQETFRNRTLTAAAKAEAFNPALVVNLLQPNMELIESVDKDGKPTGMYEPVVKITKVKDGVATEVRVKPEEAVEYLTKNPQEYGSLFKNGKAGGVGGMNDKGTGEGNKDLGELAKTDRSAFREGYRKQFMSETK